MSTRPSARQRSSCSDPRSTSPRRYARVVDCQRLSARRSIASAPGTKQASCTWPSGSSGARSPSHCPTSNVPHGRQVSAARAAGLVELGSAIIDLQDECQATRVDDSKASLFKHFTHEALRDQFAVLNSARGNRPERLLGGRSLPNHHDLVVSTNDRGRDVENRTRIAHRQPRSYVSVARATSRQPLLAEVRWLIALVVVLVVGCGGSDDRIDLEAARTFDEYPLYWVGEQFEGLDITNVALGGPGAGFTYGTCDIEPFGHGCAAPLQIQIIPLCSRLDTAANRAWTRRRIRGAPVGVFDGAPVMYTRRTQIKVYRGQGSDPGLALRALRALRSVDDVPPRIGPRGAIPRPAPGVLGGPAPCSD